MKIEILYFDGCPNRGSTVERVKEALRQEGMTADIVEVNVRDDAAAQSYGFLGSPSVRINGLDIEASAPPSNPFGMMCRTYVEEGKRVGLPSRELIRMAIRETRKGLPAEPGRNWLLGASLGAAIAASLCCILPILTAMTGLGVLAAGVKFEPWRPYLLGATGLLLGAGIVLACRNYRKACAPGSLCAAKPMKRWNFIALGTVTMLVAGLAAFPHYSGAVAE